MTDDEIVQAFVNFLTWEQMPPTQEHPILSEARHVPPAWWAYTLGATGWCPPKGEW